MTAACLTLLDAILISTQAVGSVYAIGTSHGLVLVFGRCILHCIYVIMSSFYPICADGKEQLRSVLSPYQKGTSEAGKCCIHFTD